MEIPEEDYTRLRLRSLWQTIFFISFSRTSQRYSPLLRNTTIKRTWWSRMWDRYKAKDRGKGRSSARESVDAREVRKSEDGGKSTIAGWGDKLRRGGTSTALRAFKPGVKPGFISDLFTPGKQLTHGPAIPRPVSSVYSKQSRRDSFYLTNDPGIANHSRKKQFIPVKWTHSMSFWFKARRMSIVSWA